MKNKITTNQEPLEDSYRGDFVGGLSMAVRCLQGFVIYGGEK